VARTSPALGSASACRPNYTGTWRRAGSILLLRRAGITLTLLIGDMFDANPARSADVPGRSPVFCDGGSLLRTILTCGQSSLYEPEWPGVTPRCHVATHYQLSAIVRGVRPAGFDTHKVPGHGYKRTCCGRPSEVNTPTTHLTAALPMV